ncbi:hypothetical protein GCM10009634_55780 [Saccharothrix xinjiangensis]
MALGTSSRLTGQARAQTGATAHRDQIRIARRGVPSLAQTNDRADSFDPGTVAAPRRRITEQSPIRMT